jgi:hypothetical protein
VITLIYHSFEKGGPYIFHLKFDVNKGFKIAWNYAIIGGVLFVPETISMSLRPLRSSFSSRMEEVCIRDKKPERKGRVNNIACCFENTRTVMTIKRPAPESRP